MGDACIDPASVLERLVANQYGNAVAEYYIRCPVDGAVKESGPFNALVRQARLNIDKSEQLVSDFATLTEMNYSPKDVSAGLRILFQRSLLCNNTNLHFQVQPSLDKLTRSLKMANQKLADLAGLVDCAPLHHRYLEVVDVTCRKAL